ncbi:hypothetical protein C0Q70_07195 [Pomacea canaliculata]|uniref:Palmitoyltransferase n=2 Tax=Pomacea canaliculata TaxID=400727 RepID=A0A2T7PEE9_POMCA|nr:hypothetical protein C0Q70_07195 [Pomacea canaliculata]
MDMDRTAEPSLSERLSSGRDGGRRRMPTGSRPPNRNWLTPDSVARYALPAYLLTITVTWYMGVSDVLPVLYSDWGETFVLWQQGFVTVVFVETMLNWLCIRYVDSSYTWYLKKKHALGGRGRARGHELGGHGDRNNVPTFGSPRSISLNLGDSRENLAAGEDSCRHPNGATMVENLERGDHRDDPRYKTEERSMLEDRKGFDEAWRPTFRPPQRTTFSYWSWVPCYVCEFMRPPRCHHCPVCQTCVLKRDHHCYFAGACVGWRNQRHFIVFSVWAVLAVIYALGHAVPFLYSHLWPHMAAFDLIAPVAVLRWLVGYLPGRTCLCIVVIYLLLYFLLLTSGFLHEQAALIRKGVTSFEVSNLKKSLELEETRCFRLKMRSVFGRYWALNLIVPLHWVFETEEDPENWPHVKVHRH